MPINPNISLQVQQPQGVDVLGTLGRSMNLAEMSLNNQARRQMMQQQEEAARIENENRMAAQREQEEIRGALADGGATDWTGSIDRLKRLGTPTAMKYAGDLETALQNRAKAKAEEEAKNFETGQKKIETFANALSVLDNTPDDLKPAVYSGIVNDFQQRGFFPEGFQAPAQYDPQWVEQRKAEVIDAKTRMDLYTKQRDENRAAELHPLTVQKATADASLATRTAAGDAPIQPKDRLTSDQLNFERAVKDGSFKGSFEQWLTQDANRKKPVTSITTNVSTQDSFKNESSLRKEFDDLPTVKAYNEVKTQVARAEQAYAQALDPKNKGRSSNASDQVIITVLNKVLDPTSVVRESEYGRTAEGQAVMRKLEGYLTKLKTGGAGISSGERDDIMQTIRGLSSAMESRYAPVAEQYRGLAQQYGMEPSRVVGKAGNAPGAGNKINELRTKYNY